MPRNMLFAVTIYLCILVLMGCSSFSDNQAKTEIGDNPILSSIDPDSDVSERVLSGLWTMEFDLASKTVEVMADNRIGAHINARPLLPAPTIVLNGVDMAEQTVDVDFTINNPYSITAYDVRLIVFTDAVGHRLLNFDSWTNLYDIPAGLPINPFKAYAKDEPNRQFAGPITHTENLLIKLPGMNTSVQFAIDASFPSNCTEPYEITDFEQSTLHDIAGLTADVSVRIYDWQDNVNSVYFYCPQISGAGLLRMTDVRDDWWSVTITNNTGLGAGYYPAYVIAYSSDSGSQALYTELMIRIKHEHKPISPQIISTTPTYAGMGIEFYNHYQNTYESVAYVFLADSYGGVKLFNVMDRENPSLISEMPLGGMASDVAVWERARYVFATDMLNGYFHTLDYVYISSPYIDYSKYLGGITTTVHYDSYRAYVANGYGGFAIFDVSDPEFPFILNGISTLDYANDVVAKEYLMLTAEYSGGVRVWDLRDINNPSVEATINMDRAMGLKIYGGIRPNHIQYAYVAEEWNGVHVLKIDGTTPYEVTHIKNIDTYSSSYGRALQLDAEDNFLYVANKIGGLCIIDIRNPYDAYIFNEVETSGLCFDVSVRDKYAYLATGVGLEIVKLWE